MITSTYTLSGIELLTIESFRQPVVILVIAYISKKQIILGRLKFGYSKYGPKLLLVHKMNLNWI